MPPANRLLHRRTAGRVVEPHATPQIVRRSLEQAAYDHGGAGRHGGARVRDPCRVGFGDGHVFGRDAQPCRRELGEDRQGPLAHLDVGAQHFDPAVGPARHTHPRLERDLAAAGEPRAVIERGEPGAAAQRGVGRVEGGVPSLLFPVAGELQRPLHHGQAIRAVLDDLTGGGGLAVGQQIDAPQLDGIHSERPGDHVHVALARELRLGRAESAEGAERHGVREHRATGDAHVVARVRTRGVDDGARQDDR